MEDFSTRVADHYNQVEQTSVKERKKSEIYDLRKFNNAMKSLMHYIAIKYTYTGTTTRTPSLRMLDLGCGKGGDLPKYIKNNRIELVVGVDIADVSIEQCKERYKTMRVPSGRRFRGEFFVADLTRVDIKPKLLELNCKEKFHVASSQFSLHYSFESFEQAVRYISNALNNLEVHGIFIGTYPDGPKLLKLARESKTPGTYQVSDILRVKFDQKELENPKPFGTKYHFKLKEVVDCPEFLVHPEVLDRLLVRLGFYKVFDRSFEEIVRESIGNEAQTREVKQIFEKHEAFILEDGKASLDPDMWAAASIYRGFCYRKIRE